MNYSMIPKTERADALARFKERKSKRKFRRVIRYQVHPEKKRIGKGQTVGNVKENISEKTSLDHSKAM